MPSAVAFCEACGAALGGDVMVELGVDRDVGGPVHEVVLAPGRRRGRLGAGVAVALAVAVGASLAVGGGGDEAAAPTTTVARPTTTAPARTTRATAPAATTTSIVAVAGPTPPPLLGEATGLRLLVATTSGLVRLDLDSGAAVGLRPGGLTLYVDELVAVRGGFLGSANGEVRAFTNAGETSEAPFVIVQLLGVDAQGRGYGIAYPRNEGDGVTLVTFDDAASGWQTVDGVPVGVETYPPAWPDGRGGFLVPVSGGVLRWTAPGVPLAPVAPGVIVAAAGHHALTRRCYPEPVCRLTLIDLDKGASREVPASAQGTAGVRLSPDGRWIARLPDIAPVAGPVAGPVDAAAPLLLVSTIDDRTIELPFADSARPPDPYANVTVSWSTDGTWLFYARAAGGGLRAWRVGLDAPIELRFPGVELLGPLAVEWAP